MSIHCVHPSCVELVRRSLAQCLVVLTSTLLAERGVDVGASVPTRVGYHDGRKLTSGRRMFIVLPFNLTWIHKSKQKPAHLHSSRCSRRRRADRGLWDCQSGHPGMKQVLMIRQLAHQPTVSKKTTMTTKTMTSKGESDRKRAEAPSWNDLNVQYLSISDCP